MNALHPHLHLHVHLHVPPFKLMAWLCWGVGLFVFALSAPVLNANEAPITPTAPTTFAWPENATAAVGVYETEGTNQRAYTFALQKTGGRIAFSQFKPMGMPENATPTASKRLAENLSLRYPAFLIDPQTGTYLGLDETAAKAQLQAMFKSRGHNLAEDALPNNLLNAQRLRAKRLWKLWVGLWNNLAIEPGFEIDGTEPLTVPNKNGGQQTIQASVRWQRPATLQYTYQADLSGALLAENPQSLQLVGESYLTVEANMHTPGTLIPAQVTETRAAMLQAAGRSHAGSTVWQFTWQ